MFVYCLWIGDHYENTKILLTHDTHYTYDEFMQLCADIKMNLINATSKDCKVMDTINGVKSIWEYSISDDLMDDLKDVLINEYGFKELKDISCYHVVEVDPYDYD